MRVWKRRDLTIISCENNINIVVACDSCGGVGEKPNDALNTPPYYVGMFTSRVALTEVYCSGATPTVLSNGVCNEMSPTGHEIVRGIKDEILSTGLDIALNGSTEENFITSMTGVGLTVVGLCQGNIPSDSLRFHEGKNHDKIVLIGKPLLGEEINLSSKGFYSEIKSLLKTPGVREIVPIGSKGVKYEADGLADLNNMKFSPYDTPFDMSKSGGPATCIIALCDGEIAEDICNKGEHIIIGEVVV